MSKAFGIPDEMRKKYIERRHRDIELLKAALLASDLAEFVRVGHQLKGNAATFGYPELGELGKKIESAGEASDRSIAEDCVREFEKWISKNSF